MSKASSNQAAAKNRAVVWPTARRPAWISDEELEWLPTDARQEAVELIASTYQELVVEADSALERAAGEEFVFLFWLGLLRSLRLRGHSRRLTQPAQRATGSSHGREPVGTGLCVERSPRSGRHRACQSR